MSAVRRMTFEDLQPSAEDALNALLVIDLLWMNRHQVAALHAFLDELPAERCEDIAQARNRLERLYPRELTDGQPPLSAPERALLLCNVWGELMRYHCR